MSLNDLNLTGCTQVRDLEPLKGMPLKRLILGGAGVTDLTPLQGMPLEDIRVPAKNITRGLDILRALKSLMTIAIQPTPPWPPPPFPARSNHSTSTPNR